MAQHKIQKAVRPQAASPKPFISEDSEAAFRHFLPLVEHLPEEALDTWNADSDIIAINLKRGVEAISSHLDELRAALPLLPLHKLLELPTLALGLRFAADRVVMPASKQEIRAHQLRLRPLRSQTLRQLEIFAERNLLPVERVDNIRSGSGPIDEAKDAVAIAALFNEHAATLANKHPFTDAELKELASDGNWLLGQLKPKGATQAKIERNADALTRDRFFTEVNQRYDELYQAGIQIWGRRGIEAHIPPLMSRIALSPIPPKPPAANNNIPSG